MELPSLVTALVITALLKRHVTYILRTGLGTLVWAVFNYAKDCWHIPHIDIVPAVFDSFRADFHDGRRCFARTDCLAELPAVCYYPLCLLLHCRMDLSSGQPPSRSTKIKGHTVMEICDIGEVQGRLYWKDCFKFLLQCFEESIVLAISVLPLGG